MNPEIPLSHTLIGIAVCFLASYLLTAICAWICGHPTPFKFWRDQ